MLEIEKLKKKEAISQLEGGLREIVRKGLERKIREMKIIGIDPILVARLLEVGSSNPLITFSWGNPPNIFLYDIFRQINN